VGEWIRRGGGNKRKKNKKRKEKKEKRKGNLDILPPQSN
jgi:hypothetical protein